MNSATSHLTRAIARAETMLAIAGHLGVDLDEIDAVRCRLTDHESMFDAAEDWCTRNEAERLMAIDIDELAVAYKRLAAAVERGGEA